MVPLAEKICKKKAPVWLLVLALIPLTADGATQLFGLRESTNFLRLFTGSFLGATISLVVFPFLLDASERLWPQLKIAWKGLNRKKGLFNN
jgi:uncharacterized membrane protein